MAEETKEAGGAPASAPEQSARSKDEIALELMKFIAVQTGYGKGTGTAGYGSAKTTKTNEEYAEALIQLFERCRQVVKS